MDERGQPVEGCARQEAGRLLRYCGVNAGVHKPQRMYNLTVEGAHTFFVGDGGWLVHNCPAGAGGVGRSLDDILASDDLFMQWANREHPANRLLSAADAQKVWDKFKQLGFNPRRDEGHIRGRYCKGPHINVPGTGIHIPVDSGWRP